MVGHEAVGLAPAHLNSAKRTTLHIAEQHREQLALAGVSELSVPDVSWLTSDVSRFALNAPFALLVPGSARGRLRARWPENHYLTLIQRLINKGITPVLIGDKDEHDLLYSIAAKQPGVKNLCGEPRWKTSPALPARRFWPWVTTPAPCTSLPRQAVRLSCCSPTPPTLPSTPPGP